MKKAMPEWAECPAAVWEWVCKSKKAKVKSKNLPEFQKAFVQNEQRLFLIQSENVLAIISLRLCRRKKEYCEV